ncbi:hypothetical protein CXB51_031756 [Gossypium anomalum]|uniref:non-specific serine/threonine protein kinase n=1 Tax=Gossypium anomalum TaxID=47600 RepID=A0A8J6CHF1_9ROSI|nr:hypothetical protein CXB51_031756 [Gossypium anomalum]
MGTRVGKYELGRTLGEESSAKVKFAKNMETGECVAIKILDHEQVLRRRILEQIKREISIMKLIKHPNVIKIYEVMASKTKIYIVIEYVGEDEARTYFQQLISAVDFCHGTGVYHRDLEPENLLLDTHGVLKISDFGLSALSQQVWANLVTERKVKPMSMNAFELISRSQSFCFDSLFEKQMSYYNLFGLWVGSEFGTTASCKATDQFCNSQCPPNEIISKIEDAAKPLGFNVDKRNYKMKLKGDKSGRKGELSVATEVFEVAPCLHMVEFQKSGGDILEFHKVYTCVVTFTKIEKLVPIP